MLAAMRRSRPVFHSEADFQHELAWQAHLLDPLLRVRLEYRPAAELRESVDVLLFRPDLGRTTALELKYLKAAWTGTVDGEPYALPNTGAHDIVRYDVIKDVARLERFVEANPGWNGVMLCLTNDSLHWRVPQVLRATIADAFRIHEGAQISGERAWDPRAGKGTTQGRTQSLALRGQYRTAWLDYSTVDSTRSGMFRMLVIPVTRGES